MVKWVNEITFHVWKYEFTSCCRSHDSGTGVLCPVHSSFIHIISTRCCLRYVTSPTGDNKILAFISNVTGTGWQSCIMWTARESGFIKVLTTPSLSSFSTFSFYYRVGFISPGLDSYLGCMWTTQKGCLSFSFWQRILNKQLRFKAFLLDSWYQTKLITLNQSN